MKWINYLYKNLCGSGGVLMSNVHNLKISKSYYSSGLSLLLKVYQVQKHHQLSTLKIKELQQKKLKKLIRYVLKYSESVAIACECEHHNGLHAFNDFYYLEVVDQNYKILDKGNYGKLLLTSLFNYTQPLIRYSINDELAYDDRLLKCEWPFRFLRMS